MYAHRLCVTLKCLQHIWPLIFSPMVRWTIFLVPSRLVGKTDYGETSPRCRPVWERRRVITPSEMTLNEFVSSMFMLYVYLPPTQHMLEGAYHIITHPQELKHISWRRDGHFQTLPTISNRWLLYALHTFVAINHDYTRWYFLGVAALYAYVCLPPPDYYGSYNYIITTVAPTGHTTWKHGNNDTNKH